MTRSVLPLRLAVIVVLSLPVQSRASTYDYGPGSIPGPLTTHARAAVARYGELVNRQLYDRFGLGANNRNIYCEGPAVIRFEIMPDGAVRGIKLVKRSLPKLNAHLVARLGTMRYPHFFPGMPDRPYTKIFRYGVSPLAEHRFNAEKLACR